MVAESVHLLIQRTMLVTKTAESFQVGMRLDGAAAGNPDVWLDTEWLQRPCGDHCLPAWATLRGAVEGPGAHGGASSHALCHSSVRV